MKIRFQADADLKDAIVSGVLRRSALVDFQRARGVLLDGLPDPEVLSIAADEGRVLVSHDRNTMESHFRAFIQTRTSPGLILVPQGGLTIGQAIECLVLLWEVVDDEELQNRVCLLPSLVICQGRSPARRRGTIRLTPAGEAERHEREGYWNG